MSRLPSRFFTNGLANYTANAAVVDGLRLSLVLASGELRVTPAAAAVADIGTADANAAAGELVNVVDFRTPGHIRMVAAKAIAVGAAVFGAAGGKVTDSSATGAIRIGFAVTAAAADNDQLLVCRAATDAVTA